MQIFILQPSLEHLERTLFVRKKFMKLTMLRLVCGFSCVVLPMILGIWTKFPHIAQTPKTQIALLFEQALT